MKDHIVISLVSIVTVAVPIRSIHMQLNMTSPHLIANADAGLQKSGPASVLRLPG